MKDAKIIRAGFSSKAFIAGSAQVDIAGMFSPEDAEDLVAMLEMTIRSVKRQSAPPESEAGDE